MKIARTLFLPVFLGISVFSALSPAKAYEVADADVLPTQTIECDTHAFYLMETDDGVSFDLFEVYERIGDSPGIKWHTKNLQNKIPENYNIHEALLSCRDRALKIEFANTEDELRPSFNLTLLVTNSGRILDISEAEVSPLRTQPTLPK